MPPDVAARGSSEGKADPASPQ